MFVLVVVWAGQIQTEPSLRPPERGLLEGFGVDEPAATGFALHSFSRLCVKDTRVNSPATLWMPRSRNCLKPRTCLVSPWTGSVRPCDVHTPPAFKLGPHGGAQRRPDLYLLTYPGLVVSLPTRGYVGVELSFGEHTQIAFAAISRIAVNNRGHRSVAGTPIPEGPRTPA